MKKLDLLLKRALIGMPLVMIIGASFLPMRSWAHQVLVLLTIIWFYLVLFTEVLGK